MDEDGKEHSNRNLIDQLAQEFSLTDAERRERLPSGEQLVFDNRVSKRRTTTPPRRRTQTRLRTIRRRQRSC
ncbi:winged helix-turn-helix domain-containing protein [Hydrogenophilus thiooxidans]|uniref:winged helix-turn-helix domain-containing protein n=1 Tax=Hydrogenophilus thiooxidans TaxID=2820326 RepID=UPI001C21D77F